MPLGIRIANFTPRISSEPIIRIDRPWERGHLSPYCSLVYDNGLFRLWYEILMEIASDQHDPNKIINCYAESTDAIHWTKPNCGIVPVEWIHGEQYYIYAWISRREPMVFTELCVDIDHNPNCPPEAKYKTLFEIPIWDKDMGRVHGAILPDGLRWTFLPGPLVKMWGDTQTNWAWDPSRQNIVSAFSDAGMRRSTPNLLFRNRKILPSRGPTRPH